MHFQSDIPAFLNTRSGKFQQAAIKEQGIIVRDEECQVGFVLQNMRGHFLGLLLGYIGGVGQDQVTDR